MNWRDILTGTNILIVGIFLGWNIRSHAVTDRYMMARVDKYEAEAHYWITKLDNEIQENKGNIEKERTHVKR